MIKRKPVSAEGSMSYIQTDISSYYKATETKTCTSDNEETSGVPTSSPANNAPAVNSEPPSADRFSNDEEVSRSNVAIISLLSDDETDLATSEPNPGQKVAQEIIRRIPAARSISSNEQATLIRTNQEDSELTRRISACTRPISFDGDNTITNYNPLINTHQEDSEKIVRRALPDPRPLSSVDEIPSQDSAITLGTNDSLEDTPVVTPSAPKRKPSLPFRLPCYSTDSEDSDVDYCNGLLPTSLQYSASPAGRERNACLRTPVRRSRSMEDSTDDEETTPTPTKVTRLEATHAQEKVAAKYVPKRLFLSQQVEQTAARTGVSVGVHRPIQRNTISPQKRRPMILEKLKRISIIDCPNELLIDQLKGPIPLPSNLYHSILDESEIGVENAQDVILSGSVVQTAFIEHCDVSPIRATSTPLSFLTKTLDVPKTPDKSSGTAIRSPKTPTGSPRKTPVRSPRPRSWRRPSRSPKKILNRQLFDSNPKSAPSEEDKESPSAVRQVRKIVEYISSHNHLSQMLTIEEVRKLKDFFEKVPHDKYILLCVKLFTWIPKWYNIFSLCKKLNQVLSDPEVVLMYDYLSQNGYVDTDYSSETCEYLLDHLLLPQIKALCDSFCLTLPSKKKSDMIEKLLNHCNSQSTLTCTKSTRQILQERIQGKMGRCVKLNVDFHSLLKKIHVLYMFTTSDFQNVADLHLFMLRIDTGDIVMPQLRIDDNFEIFSSVDEFNKFADAYECKQAFVEAFDKKQSQNMFDLAQLAYSEFKKILETEPDEKSQYLMPYTAGHKYAKTISLAAKQLSKSHANDVQEWLKFLLSQDRFCQNMRGDWYDNLAMVQYHHLKLYQDATETLIEGLNEEGLSQVAKYDLSHRGETMKRSKAHKITTLQYDNISFVQTTLREEFPSDEINANAVHDNKSGRKRNYIQRVGDDVNALGVEQVALDHYRNEFNLKGIHCEGSLFNTMLFIVFWDIIYDNDVPGVFVSEIQYLPLDLWSKEFYIKRKDSIEQRLNAVRDAWPLSKLEHFVKDVWGDHAHEKSLITANIVENAEDLHQIILCIGRERLAEILKYMILDYRARRSGLPDLFLWNVDQLTCKFVEVKGEKDRLSTKQKLWLEFLMGIGIDAKVCNVHTIGSKKKHVKKKSSEL